MPCPDPRRVIAPWWRVGCRSCARVTVPWRTSARAGSRIRLCVASVSGSLRPVRRCCVFPPPAPRSPPRSTPWKHANVTTRVEELSTAGTRALKKYSVFNGCSLVSTHGYQVAVLVEAKPRCRCARSEVLSGVACHTKAFQIAPAKRHHWVVHVLGVEIHLVMYDLGGSPAPFAYVVLALHVCVARGLPCLAVVEGHTLWVTLEHSASPSQRR